MKMKLLFKSIIMLGAIMVAPLMINFVSSSSNVSYTEVRAESASQADFLTKFDEIFANKSICDATREEYDEIIGIYSNLSNEDRVNNKKKLDQTTTIIIASVVSIVGMSAISVLFILKNNKYIE